MNGFRQNLISSSRDITLGIKELRNLSLSKLRKVFSLLGKREKLALGILTVIAVSSCGFSVSNFYYLHTVATPANGGVYSEGLLGQPTYINPLLDSQEPDLSLTNLVFSGLYKYGPDGQLEPDLADGMPQISTDQKQYIINLKKNVKWHNGQNFTADDVIFTIQTLQNPDYKSPLRALWQYTTVQKLSDYSIKFTTSDISAPFINNLTLPILPKDIWDQVDPSNFLLSKYNLEAVGTGPYAIKEIQKLPSGKIEQITLDAFDDYYNGRPKIDQVVFKFYDTEDDLLNAFHSREVIGLGFVPLGSTLYLDKNQTNAQVITVPLPQYQQVFFNLNNKILSDPTVRQALNLAIDRQAIIQQVFKGNALLPVSPFLLGPQKQALPSQTDLTEAQALLDQAGWKLDPKTGLRSKKGTLFEITLATNDYLPNANTAQVLANQWQKLGIKVNLNIVPSSQLSTSVIKPRAFDALLFPQKYGADPDPFLFWHSSQVKDPGLNLTGFADPTADKLIVDARSTLDRSKRISDYQQFNDLILSQTPVIFLDQTEYIYAIDTRVKNVNLGVLYDPSNRFAAIGNWYIDESRIWK